MENPGDIEIAHGDTAIFKCNADGDPTPSIMWMHNEVEVEVDDERMAIMEDGSLVIKNAQDKDSGQYICVARNPEGSVKSRSARMTILKPDTHLEFRNSSKYLF